MIEFLRALSAVELKVLGKALRSGKVSPPYGSYSLQQYCSNAVAVELARGFQQLADDGHPAQSLALLLEALASERQRSEALTESVELVWTGPECPGLLNRDTLVVVQDLFRKATKSILVTSYALYQGKALFSGLAARMVAIPELQVRMFLDISRPQGDTSLGAMIVQRYANRFRSQEWPEGVRLPEIWYDPRALEIGKEKKACLHAKCIVVDGEISFVSSANLTEAAQQRNIEVGALIHSEACASTIEQHFRLLSERGLLEKVYS